MVKVKIVLDEKEVELKNGFVGGFLDEKYELVENFYIGNFDFQNTTIGVVSFLKAVVDLYMDKEKMTIEDVESLLKFSLSQAIELKLDDYKSDELEKENVVKMNLKSEEIQDFNLKQSTNHENVILFVPRPMKNR